MSPSAALSHICPVQLQGETLGLAPVSDSSPVRGRPREAWRELCSRWHSEQDGVLGLAAAMHGAGGGRGLRGAWYLKWACACDCLMVCVSARVALMHMC
ncbi:MAG: hypothetical protein ACPIOQ_52470, partial [Promethearchaeia archaeon]